MELVSTWGTEAQLLITVRCIAHRIASAILRDALEDAEDMAQDVVLECLLKIRAGRWYTGPDAIKPLVRWLIRRRIIDRRRWRLGEERRDFHHLRELMKQRREWMSPDSGIRVGEVIKEYQRALWGLTPACREAFILVRERGMSHEQAAATLRVKTSTVSANVALARGEVLAALQRNGISAPGLRRRIRASIGSRVEPAIDRRETLR